MKYINASAHLFFKLFFAFVTISFLCATCKKDKGLHTTIEGTVKDATTLAPIPNATILLLRQESECFSCGFNIYKTFSADGNGKYFHEFTQEKDYTYALGIQANKYFESYAQVYLNTGENNNDILLKPMGYLKIHLKNTQPVDIYDAATVYATGNNYNFYGMAVDTIFLYCSYNYPGGSCGLLGNQSNTVYYKVIKNGIETEKSASIYCTAFDTTTYNIDY